MPWPLSQDYNEALQNPQTSFIDPELRQGQVVVNALGIPQPCSGNFADVYAVECAASKTKWAVKCFTREVHGLRERYSEISSYLKKVRLPFTVDFRYLEQGIRVAGRWYPILKMHWVEGATLNAFVRNMLDKPAMLEKLSRVWLRMARRLRESGMAHCDLQHGNVLLVPDSEANALAVKLIDYDGMWVPALANTPAGESGHPAYQHPQRLHQGTYNPEVDRFPLLTVYIALRALAATGRQLWQRYDTGDNLLFRLADFEAPTKSPLLAELLGIDQPEVRNLTGKLIDVALMPLDQTPHLTDLVAEEIPSKSSIPRSRLTSPSNPPATQTRDAIPVGLIEPKAATRSRRESLLPWIAVGAIGSVSACAVVAGVLLWGLKGEGTTEEAPAQPTSAQVKSAATGDAIPSTEVHKKVSHNLIVANKEERSPSAKTTKPSDALPSVVKPNPPDPPAKPVEVPSPKPAPPPIAGKLPAPDQAVLKSVADEIQDTFKAEYASKDVLVRAALAEKLLERGLRTFETPLRRFVFLQEAGDVASKLGDVSLSFRAIDEMCNLFAVNELALKASALQQAAKSARTPNAHKVIVDTALALIVVAIQADDYDTADRCIPAATQAAYRAGVPSREVQFVAKEVSRFKKNFLAVKPALATLAARPDNAEANRLVGIFLCFLKGDWRKGLPLLARGDDAKLKELAEKDLAAPEQAEAQVDIGDGWWQLGKKGKDRARTNLLHRACYWYERALPDTSAAVRVRLLKNIEAHYQSLPLLRSWDHLDISQATEMLGFLRLYKGEKEILTRESYSGPIEIALIARTEKNNVRLRGGQGSCVIFNWERKAEELRITRPDGQQPEGGSVATAAVTPLRPNTWYTLRWIITEEVMAVSVNGRTVFSESHKNDLSVNSVIRVHSVDSDIDVRAFRVRSLAKNRR